MGKRIIAQRRGKGHPPYLSPSHKHLAPARLPRTFDGVGTVREIRHAPGRTTPLALVEMQDGTTAWQIANEGMTVGERLVYSTTRPEIRPGNTCILSAVPEGTPIFNVEGTPGDGGKFGRAAGNSSYVVGQAGGRVMVLLPSGKVRAFNPGCRATIGLPAGGGQGDKPLVKAGKTYHKHNARARNWPKVRGVAMNPIDHPHGGGSHNYPGKPTSVARGTPPGRKVGHIAPKRTGKR